MSQEEWEAIPDVGDYSLKYKQNKRREIFTPMPDHVIEGARNESAVSTYTRTHTSACCFQPYLIQDSLGFGEVRGCRVPGIEPLRGGTCRTLLPPLCARFSLI